MKESVEARSKNKYKQYVQLFEYNKRIRRQGKKGFQCCGKILAAPKSQNNFGTKTLTTRYPTPEDADWYQQGIGKLDTRRNKWLTSGEDYVDTHLVGSEIAAELYVNCCYWRRK